MSLRPILAHAPCVVHTTRIRTPSDAWRTHQHRCRRRRSGAADDECDVLAGCNERVAGAHSGKSMRCSGGIVCDMSCSLRTSITYRCVRVRADGIWRLEWAAFRVQRNDPVAARVVRAAFAVTPRQGVSYVISICMPYSQYRKHIEMLMRVRGAERALCGGIQLSFSRARARLSHAIVRARHARGFHKLRAHARARVRARMVDVTVKCALRVRTYIVLNGNQPEWPIRTIYITPEWNGENCPLASLRRGDASDN